VGQPYFAPGFNLRITGEVREIPQKETEEKAKAGNQVHRYALEDQFRYPSMKLFSSLPPRCH
jgi:hypothetical protein